MIGDHGSLVIVRGCGGCLIVGIWYLKVGGGGGCLIVGGVSRCLIVGAWYLIVGGGGRCLAVGGGRCMRAQDDSY